MALLCSFAMVEAENIWLNIFFLNYHHRIDFSIYLNVVKLHHTRTHTHMYVWCINSLWLTKIETGNVCASVCPCAIVCTVPLTLSVSFDCVYICTTTLRIEFTKVLSGFDVMPMEKYRRITRMVSDEAGETGGK